MKERNQVDILVFQEEGEDVASMRQRLKEAMPRRSMPGHGDSVEKILQQLAVVAKHEVTYRKKALATPPNTVRLAPSIFREFTCVEGCTACCCVAITLDYIPSEVERLAPEVAETFAKRTVVVNGQEHDVYTNDQRETTMCDYLKGVRPNGGLGCGLFPFAPLSCVSAPQLQFVTHGLDTFILKRPFTRGWAMALKPHCEFTTLKSNWQDVLGQDIAMLKRFEEWADHFGIKTYLPEVRGFMEQVVDERMPIPRYSSVIFKENKQ